MAPDDDSIGQVLRRAQYVFGSADVATHCYHTEPLLISRGAPRHRPWRRFGSPAGCVLLDLIEGGFLG